MSTRSMVGWESEGRGRYIHSDGYPNGVGLELCMFIREYGVEETMAVLTEEHYGWSSVEFGKEPWDSVERDFYGDGRFECVVGWGTAYTDTVLENGIQQTDSEDWVSEDTPHNTAFQYFVTDDGIINIYEGWNFLESIDPYNDDYEEKLDRLTERIGY